mgnify:CR=1 FL=1
MHCVNLFRSFEHMFSVTIENVTASDCNNNYAAYLVNLTLAKYLHVARILYSITLLNADT